MLTYFFTQAFMKSGRPLLLSSGMSESLVAEIEMEANRDLYELRTSHYVRLQRVYALKKHPEP